MKAIIILISVVLLTTNAFARHIQLVDFQTPNAVMSEVGTPPPPKKSVSNSKKREIFVPEGYRPNQQNR